MKDLNVIEILKLGLIGLGFLLALFSYYLLRQEMRRDNIRPKAISAIKFFMLFSTTISILTIFWEVFKQPDNLKIIFGNREFSVSPLKPVNISQVNASDYYINSDYDFAFKKVDNNLWTKVKEYDGLDGFFELNFNKADSAYRIQLLEQIELSPVGQMITHQKMFQVANLNSSLSIELTDSTTNPQIDHQMKLVRESILKEEEYDLNDPDEIAALNDNLQEFKNSYFLNVRHLNFQNQFVVSVLPKSFLPDYLKTMSVSDFFKYSSEAIPSISQLIATQNSILVKGVSTRFSNVLVNNKPGEFQSDKLLLYGENNKYFYIVEITYSPQANMPTQTWSDLEELQKSFTLISE